MAKELYFDGKKYITTKDAAARTGYTHDYIGQLSRTGKIPGRLVGRAKYIEEDALLQYKEESEVLKSEQAKARSVKYKSGRKVPIKTRTSVTTQKTQTEEKSAIPQQQKQNESDHTHSLPNTRTHGEGLHPVSSLIQPQQKHVQSLFEQQMAHTARTTQKDLPSPYHIMRVSVATLATALVLIGGVVAVSQVTIRDVAQTAGYAADRTYTTAKGTVSGFVRITKDAYLNTYENTDNDKNHGSLMTYIRAPLQVIDEVLHSPHRVSHMLQEEVRALSIAASEKAPPSSDTQPTSMGALVRSVNTQTKDTFNETPDFTLLSYIHKEMVEKTKRVRYELAYVGAAMEYRFLELGADMNDLLRKGAVVVYEIPQQAVHFVEQYVSSIHIFSRAVAEKEITYIDTVSGAFAAAFSFGDTVENTRSQIAGIGGAFTYISDNTNIIFERVAIRVYEGTQAMRTFVAGIISGETEEKQANDTLQRDEEQNEREVSMVCAEGVCVTKEEFQRVFGNIGTSTEEIPNSSNSPNEVDSSGDSSTFEENSSDNTDTASSTDTTTN